MLFTSLEFFAFLPLTLLLFSLLPVRHRWAWLLLASYFFYGVWQPFNLVYLGAVTLIVYGCGQGMARAAGRSGRIAFLTLGLVAGPGSMFAFKFYDFIAGEAAGMRLRARALLVPRLGVST